ncbi:MAG: hypothetical protein GAK45_00621 [Pseudomonas citronellolis]|nr:MAG: hypothetical protein GAK45_00621 [Pseudomonas citronellolis]
MSSTDTQANTNALNQQARSLKSVTAGIEKLDSKTRVLANSYVRVNALLTESPERLEQYRASLQRIGELVSKPFSEDQVKSFASAWQKAWATYTDKDTRTKAAEGVTTQALKGSEDYLYSLATTGHGDFRKYADPVLDDLRKVVAREAVIGLTDTIGKSEWWHSLVIAIAPSAADKTTDENVDADAEADILTGGRQKKGAKTEGPSPWISGALKGWKEYLSKAGGISTAVQGLFDSSLGATQNYLVSVLTSGDVSFRSLANSVIESATRIAAQFAVSGLSQLLGGAASSVGSFVMSFFQADGGAWQNGVQLYAQGGAFGSGVVRSPTLFGAANGRLGVMGEAGPEAILPLTRTADGALGVRSLGGGSGGTAVQIQAPVSVVVSDRSADGMQIDQQALAGNLQRQIQAAAEKAVAESWRPGGVSYRNASGRA